MRQSKDVPRFWFRVYGITEQLRRGRRAVGRFCLIIIYKGDLRHQWILITGFPSDRVHNNLLNLL